MADLVVTKWPVVILSNYRTGSTGFGIMLKHQYNATFFGEPATQENYEDFVSEFETGNRRFVLKVMIDQLYTSPIYQQILSSDCFKIRLLRENVIEQCMSYYIGQMRNVWQHKVGTIQQPYSIPVDTNSAAFTVKVITENDKKLRECDVQFDQECTYETIDFSNSPRIRKIVPPDNVDEIRELITRIYNERTNKRNPNYPPRGLNLQLSP